MLLATLALTCLPQGTHLPDAQTTPESAPFFVAKSPLVIPGRVEANAKNWTLFDLVDAYEKSTGHRVVATSKAEQMLAGVGTLTEEAVTVTPERVQSTFEAWMTESDMVLLPPNDLAPRLIGLSMRQFTDIVQLPLEPRLIDWTEAESYADHVGTLFQTIVPVQGAEARTLANSMRGKITDANTSQMLPLGRSNCILVRGTGYEVATWTAMIRESAREAGLVMPDVAEATPTKNKEMDATLGDLELTVPSRGAAGWTVSDLCKAYSKLMNVPVEVGSESVARAEATPVGLTGELHVTGAQVPYTVEFLCRAKGFCLDAAEEGGALTLRHVRSGAAPTAQAQTLETVSSWMAQPARLVEVDIPMTEFDPRIMANVLRVLFVDPNINGMSSTPGTPALKIRGFASNVAGQAVLFERAGEVARALRSADPNREE